MKRHYEKLIRDRIPEIMDAAEVDYQVRKLDDEAYRDALRAKLVEEAAEVVRASRDDLAKELADLLEVIHALARLEELDLRDIENVRRVRADERGAFDERLFLEWTVEHAG